MRRASFSIGRFLPAIAMTNTAGFFQSFRFHSAGTKNYRNELVEFSETPWQEWKNKGLDPMKFAQEINERKFYDKDGLQLMALLKEYCWMAIHRSETEMEPALREIVRDYAFTALTTISPYMSTGEYDISYNPHVSEHLSDAIQKECSLPDEKKKGADYEIFITLRTLFHYVLNMGPELRRNGSAPDATFSPRSF